MQQSHITLADDVANRHTQALPGRLHVWRLAPQRSQLRQSCELECQQHARDRAIPACMRQRLHDSQRTVRVTPRNKDERITGNLLHVELA
jgi:hypothetical protein